MISLRSHRMLFAAFCVVLATTDAHDDHELRTFHNLSFTNPGIGRDYSKNDIVDKLSFNLYDGETLINKKKAISLFVLDPEEQVWVAASFKISRKPDAQGRLELRKPLVGYEMETESACKKRGLTKLPYVKNRWGENSCSKYMMDGSDKGPRECYMVVAKVSTSTMELVLPEGCNLAEAPETVNACLPDTTWTSEDGKDLNPFSDTSNSTIPIYHPDDPRNDTSNSTKPEEYPNRKKRQTNSPYSLTAHPFKFGLIKNTARVKFVCSASVKYMGASVNLAGGTPVVEAKLYYSKSAIPWSLLAELPFKSFSGGASKFRSTLHISTLTSQGVETPSNGGCYKCEVRDVDGVIVDKLCIGTNCDC